MRVNHMGEFRPSTNRHSPAYLGLDAAIFTIYSGLSGICCSSFTVISVL
jgi:hypothetical protein